jgi:hypothetical protein
MQYFHPGFTEAIKTEMSVEKYITARTIIASFPAQRIVTYRASSLITDSIPFQNLDTIAACKYTLRKLSAADRTFRRGIKRY